MFTIIYFGICILIGAGIVIFFIYERRYYEKKQRDNWPIEMERLAYFMSPDVDVWGNRVPGSEEKTVKEVVENGLRKYPRIKAEIGACGEI
jgi:uncharacterized protein YneF (UPF0154 family)